MAQRTIFRKSEYPIAAAVGLVALAVYLATMAPTVLFADGGEFQFVPWLPGIAHPTGYPLYVLTGWLFSHALPIGEVAWRLNLFSAITGAAAVAMVYLLTETIARQTIPAAGIGAKRVTAAIAALSFAFGQTFWSQAIIAEVYSLHALFVAAILWATVNLFPAENDTVRTLTFRRGKWLALLLGLSLTHHRTAVLLIPAVAAALWVSGWRRIGWGDALKLLALGASPAVLYLYLPLIAPHVPYAQIQLSDNRTLVLYQNTVAGFFSHIMGGTFNADVRPTAIGFDRLAQSFGFLRQQIGWAGIAAAVIGIFRLRKNLPALTLTALGAAAIWAFNLAYFIGDIYVLFIPVWLIFAVWLALGMLAVADAAADRLVTRKRARVAESPAFGAGFSKLDTRMRHLTQWLMVMAGLLLPLVLLATRYSAVDLHQNTIARDAWQEILAADLPENAILMSNDRNELMPMWYFQYVENRRRDLLGLFPLITPAADVQNVGRLLDTAFAGGRAVYFIKPMDGLGLKADFDPLPPLPHAQLVRATPANLVPAVPLSAMVGNSVQIAGYTLTRTENALTVDVFWQAKQPLAENYTGYVHLLGADGDGIAQDDHRPGGEFYPTRLWQPGEILRDRYTLPYPADMPTGGFSLVAGMYLQPQPGVIQPLGEAVIFSGP